MFRFFRKLKSRALPVRFATGLAGPIGDDCASTPVDHDFPVGVTGKVLKRELRARYGTLKELAPRENRAIADFMAHRPDSAVA